MLRNQTDIGNAIKPSRADMRAMMKTHLDETLKQAQDRLTGNFAGDVRDCSAATGASFFYARKIA